MLCQSNDGMLRGSISSSAFVGNQTGDGCDVDDSAAVPLDHLRQNQFAQMEDRFDINVIDQIPQLFAGIQQCRIMISLCFQLDE